MATIKSSDLVSFVISAKQSGWGYVFGGQGQLYTKELAEDWARRRRSGRNYDYFVVRCARWFGKIVVDCSGLIIEAYRSQNLGYGDKTANTLFRRCVQTGRLSTIPDIPGLCVWRSGHIGLYIGDGKVVEAGGTSVGVVTSELQSPATNKRWTNWGRMSDVDYENTSTPPKDTDNDSLLLCRYLKLMSPYIKGEDVKGVQKALVNQGESPGAIDGIYGPNTEAAVMAFQQSKNLEVDGIVGPNTIAALQGTWSADCEGNQDTPLGVFKLNRLLKLTSPYMRGDDVGDVQDALLQASFSPGATDGIYGPKTEAAIERFQQSKGLAVDGIVGPNTSNELGGLWTAD